jgi:hypothetical protein
MKFEILNSIQYFCYYKYRFSKAGNLGPISFDAYVKMLGPENVIISEGVNFKRIQWEDVCTRYIFRFSREGEFQFIELQHWFEFTWPWLTKKVILDVGMTL